MRTPLLILLAIATLTGCSRATALEPPPTAAPAPVLRISEPHSGETVTSDLVRVSGTAPAGSRVVHDVSLGRDSAVTAGPDGSWWLDVRLEEGANELTFRVGDDRRSAVTIVLVYARAPAVTPAASQPPTPARTAPPTPTPTPTATPTPTPTATPTPTLAPLGAAPIGPTEAAVVVRVVDGDTIQVDRGRGPEKVRYIGIDTPETVHPSKPVEWMGAEASAANRKLVEGREVILESDVSETDQYGRLLRYVWTRDDDRWTFVNLALVSRGFAQVSTYPPDVRYVDLYLARQAAAREHGLGLWGTPPPEPATPAPVAPQVPAREGCDASYPGVCIPPAPPDLDCGQVAFRRFVVVGSDPHGFDGDRDGVGCESG